MADLAPAAVPSQIDLGIGPIRMQPEQFLYPQVKRTEDLATFAMEIDALAHDEWRPASPDFRAISIRTNGMKPISAQSEVKSVQDFFEKVALAPTTNFFGYMQHDDPANPSIPFVARVTRHQFFPSEELNVAKIDELKQRIQSSGDPLAALIRMIRNVNAADPRKRLFLYLCSFFSEPSSWPARLLAEGLADLLDMEVFFLGEPIWFRPDLHALPRDQKRGQISLGTSLSVAKTGNIVDNAHDLTPNMLSVP
jgi:hypothetical protein